MLTPRTSIITRFHLRSIWWITRWQASIVRNAHSSSAACGSLLPLWNKSQDGYRKELISSAFPTLPALEIDRGLTLVKRREFDGNLERHVERTMKSLIGRNVEMSCSLRPSAWDLAIDIWYAALHFCFIDPLFEGDGRISMFLPRQEIR